MKTVFYNPKGFLMAFIVFGLSIMHAQELQRSINKNFPLKAGGKLHIENSYGTVKLNSWDKNEVAIEVTISVKGGTSERAEELLEDIDILFNTSTDEVRAITQLPEKNRSWWKNFSFIGVSKLDYSIDYLVQMPQAAELHIDNAYGNIYLDETDGITQLECAYGRLEVGKLNHSENTIKLAYAPSSEIDLINGGHIEADYSGLSIGRANTLIYAADYSKSSFGQIENLNFEADYGSLSIDDVNSLKGEADYLTIKVNNLAQELDINMDYGSLKVVHIEPSTRDISIRADYTGIKLGADTNWAFSFIIETEYAGFRTDFPLDYSRKIIESSEHYYKGKHLSGENQLSIKADYGSIKLTQN